MVDTKRINLLTSVDAPTAGDRIVIDGLTTRSIEYQKLGAYLTNIPWASVVTVAGQLTLTLTATHRRAFIVVDTYNGGSTVGTTTITLETAAAAGAGTFVTIKKRQSTPAQAHGGMIIVVPSGSDFLEGKIGDVVAENRVRWEYPGEEFTWISDGVNRWHLVGSLWLKRGALFKGTHTGTSASYSTASPYAIDLVTGNGQWFQLDCSDGTPQAVAIDLPSPSTTLADGYAQTTFAVQRNDGAAFTGYVRTAAGTYDGKEVGYAVPLYNFLDTAWIRSDGQQYRTMAEFHAHQSEICECKLSTSASVVTNGVVSAATTIHFPPYSGMRVALPTDEAPTHYQRWIIHSFPSTPISKALGSAGTYGVAAGNSVWHDVFCWHPSGFVGPALFLAPSYAATRGTGAGTSELILLGGIRVNKFAISGSTSVPAQAARYVGRIFTNGAGAAILVLDEYDDAPGNQLLAPSGNSGTGKTGIGFKSDPDTGIVNTSSGGMQFLSNGAAVFTTSSTAITMENGAAIVTPSIAYQGSTSGIISVAAAAIAGTNTITLPAGTGTVALSSLSNAFTGVQNSFVNDSGSPQISLGASSTNFAGAQYVNGTVTAQFGVTTNLAFKTVTNHSIVFGTFNADALTIAGDKSIYTPNATGTAMGANTINALAQYDNGLRTSRAVGSGTSGSTNDSASGSGAYITHTGITVTVPANGITTGRLLRVRAFLRFTTGTVPTVFSYALTLGGTQVVEITPNTPFASMTARTAVIDFNVIGLAAPGAAANTESGITGSSNSFAGTAILNAIAQPVALATNGTLAVAVQTKWASAGTGPNTVTLTGLSAEFVN